MKRNTWNPQYHVLRQALKQMRLDAELTQAQLAVRLGKPQSFVAKYENGDRNLDFLEVLDVCRACHRSPQDILRCLEPQSSPANVLCRES